MKNLISLSLIFLISCSQAPVQRSIPDSLEALLDKDDLKIHRCLQKRGNALVSMDLKTRMSFWNQAYEGGFLTLGASISGEAIGIPVDLGGAYSFGLNLRGFAGQLQSSRNAGTLKITQLASEIVRLSDAQPIKGLTRNNNGYAAMMSMALMPLGILGIRPPSLSNLRSVNTVVKDALTHHRSLGIQFKSYYKTYLEAHLRRNNFPMLNEFFSRLTQSMTGCDSVGGSAALALSLSPVALSVAYENFSLLMEMAFEDLRVLKVLTPMVLLNPLLMQAEDLRAITRVSRGILGMPTKVARNCGEVFPRMSSG